MDGDSRDLHARVERIGDGVRALERGQKRRMQVEHAVGEGVEHDGRDLAHVAGHDHVLRAGFLQRGHDLRVGRLGVGVLFAVHDQHGDAGGVRALDAVRIGTRRDHLHHLDGQTLRRLIKDGLEIRAAAGEQHADLQLFGHETAFHQAAPNQPRDSHFATSIRAGGEASPRSRQAPSSIQGEGERKQARTRAASAVAVLSCSDNAQAFAIAAQP